MLRVLHTKNSTKRELHFIRPLMEQLSVWCRLPNKFVRKSAQLPKKALLDFLPQYRLTSTNSGFSSSQLLNDRQILSKLGAILPSPAYIKQGKQTRAIFLNDNSRYPMHNFKAGGYCHELYFGPKDPKWVPAVVVKRTGTSAVQFLTVPQGGNQPNQARTTPFETDNFPISKLNNNAPAESSTQVEPESLTQKYTSTLLHSPVYGSFNPQRSKRARKRRTFYSSALTDYS